MSVALPPAVVLYGEPVLELPKDLFIPPNALRIVLAEFEGPLDLLLYLIRKQNLNILNIPIALITEQYLHYIADLQSVSFELAGEYLLMASILLDIKSRMLLPTSEELTEETEEDPRSELMQRLLAYEAIQLATKKLQQLPHAGRDFIWFRLPVEKKVLPAHEVGEIERLQLAWLAILNRQKNIKPHTVENNKVTIKAQADFIMSRLEREQEIDFNKLLLCLSSIQSMVVTFIALLELAKRGLVTIRQEQPFETIFLSK